MLLTNFPTGTSNRIFQFSQKTFRSNAHGVRTSQQNTICFQNPYRCCKQSFVIAFDLENTVFLGLRKSWRIENHDVEPALLVRQPSKPIERVPEDEIVCRGIDLV